MNFLNEWVIFTRFRGGARAHVSKRFSNYPRRFHINYVIKWKKLLGSELMATFDLTDCKVGWSF